MGPQEDPANTPEETETTQGETVEAGATPTEVPETPTVFETPTDGENATDGGGDNGTTEEGGTEGEADG